MAEKIFISYNHNDKVLVDTIARRLEIEFGRNNIFYDAWSMQPGDSIIGKMDLGLSEFTTFFFFVSDNSLKSNMVQLEWQTALNRAINNDLKFVAVRIADCSIPTILTNDLINFEGKVMLNRYQEKEIDPKTYTIGFKNEIVPISVHTAAKSISCDSFLDRARALSASYENHIRHIDLPTQLNWMLSH